MAREYTPKEETLHQKLKTKNIDFYMLRPFRFNNKGKKGVMYVNCPHEKKEVQLAECRKCKEWLGSTTKVKNHWLCKK